MKRYIFATIVLAALVVVSLVSARNFPKTDLTFSPDPQVGVTSSVTGCGYDPNMEAKLYYLWSEDYPSNNAKGSWSEEKHVVTTDSNGCLSDSFTPSVPAAYQLWIYQLNPSGQNPQLKYKVDFTL